MPINLGQVDWRRGCCTVQEDHPWVFKVVFLEKGRYLKGAHRWGGCWFYVWIGDWPPAYPSKHGGRFQIKGLDLKSPIHGSRAHALCVGDAGKACFGWVPLSEYSDHWQCRGAAILKWVVSFVRLNCLIPGGTQGVVGKKTYIFDVDEYFTFSNCHQIKSWFLFRNSKFWLTS